MHAQTTQSTPVGNGMLQWAVSQSYGSCGFEGQSSYEEWVYSSFTYATGGITYPLSGSPTYFSSPGGSCPPNGGYELQLGGSVPQNGVNTANGNLYAIDFYPSLGGGGSGSLVQTGYGGYVNPKYKIVGIAYAVPGTSSYVQYVGTTMLGTSTSTSNSFSTNVTTSVSICGSTGSNVCGKGNGVAITGTYTNAFTQVSDTSSSFAVNQTKSYSDTLYPLTGPALDHGNDLIYIWVNPNVWYTATAPGAPLQWDGYTYDLNDDSNDMEVIPLRLSELLNPSTISSYHQGRLLRQWAQNNTDGSSPAITNQDLLNIAAQDPFSNPNYTVALGPDYMTTTDDRFTLQSGDGDMFYQPGITDSYGWSYTETATAGQAKTTTYSNSFAIDVQFGGGFFWQSVSYNLKNSQTFTWVDQWNNTTTSMKGQSNNVYIVGPNASYTGPQEFNIYLDNIYGTFMTVPIPEY